MNDLTSALHLVVYPSDRGYWVWRLEKDPNSWPVNNPHWGTAQTRRGAIYAAKRRIRWIKRSGSISREVVDL